MKQITQAVSNTALFESFTKINIRQSKSVLFVTFNNPPVNVLDGILMQELFQLCNAIDIDNTIKVIVFDSANKAIFLAHGDMNFVAQPETFNVFGDYIEDNRLNPMQQLHLRIKNLKQVTIGKLQGFMRGGGNELVMALDMRFAVENKTWFGQPETLMGIIPGGGGTQFLTQLVGKARALEIILSGNPIDTKLAITYGLINRAFTEEELENHIQHLVDRVNNYLPNVVNHAKVAISFANDNKNDFSKENELLGALFSSPKAVEKTLNALKNGAQTLEGELNLEAILEKN
ncbi:enoyl-CoA hydratase/isomerase family protein [Chishuiella sp.]|uniref:enoyl-CoA hydratase/isomerase family protein n=1 Tax=Chishuiella sp. TaxID=1969467 RepID=UPI0028ABF8BA|nr:enoyl-CoA hydratase/isomerase family protein [Chishuiella sp.]